jgi:PhnB protein
MKIDLHLVFDGKCREAFAFYEKTFNSKVQFAATYGEAPGGFPVPPGSEDRLMHTALPLGSITLMGCDTPAGVTTPIGGFHISISSTDEAEVKRLFAELSDGGSVQMPLTPTFWSPLFGMCTDKFGIEWMVSIPGPMPS